MKIQMAMVGVMMAANLNAQEAITLGRAAYVPECMETKALSFTLPDGITESDVGSVVYDDRHGHHPADKLWRIDGSTIQFSPVKEWAIGINLMQLRLKDGRTVDFTANYYEGKFAVKEKEPVYHQRLKEAARFRRLISASTTDNPKSVAVIKKDAFAGKKVSKVWKNGELQNGAALAGDELRCKFSNDWKTGLNKIEVQLEGEEEKHVHYLSCHPRVSKVEYTMTDCSVDGQPFYPRAIYYVKPTSFADVADYGFNVVHNYTLRAMPEPEITTYLRGAHENGLKVFVHINKPALESGDVDAFAERIATQMAEPGLFAWYFWDEPSPNDMPVEYYTFYTDLLRGLDPHHPVISSHWYLNYYRDAGEMDMRQFYHGKPSEMAVEFALYKREVAQVGSPWLAIVNTHEGYRAADTMSISPAAWKGIVNKGKTEEQKAALKAWGKARYDAIVARLENPPFPVPSSLPQTRRQIRAQAFEAIVQGSNGIFYWPYWDKDDLPARWGWYTLFHMPEPAAHMRELMHDLKKLEPLISAPSVDVSVWVEDGVRFWQRTAGDNTLVIAVNESGKFRSVSAALKPLAGQAWPDKLVRFGHQDEEFVELNQGRLSDRWKPEQAHVYLLRPLP